MHEITEFKGNKVIQLKKDEEEKYPYSFGKKKAKLIVENYEAIKKFAEEAEEESEEITEEQS